MAQTFMAVSLIWLSRDMSACIAFSISAAIGILKEVVHDLYFDRGTPEGMDAFVTILGAFVGIILQLGVLI